MATESSKEPLMCRHCEERSDAAISNRLIPLYEIATLLPKNPYGVHHGYLTLRVQASQ